MATSLLQVEITQSGNLRTKILNDFPDGITEYGDIVSFTVVLPDGNFVVYDAVSSTLFQNASFVESFDSTIEFDSFEFSLQSFIDDNVIVDSLNNPVDIDYTEFKDGIYVVNMTFNIDSQYYANGTTRVFRKTAMTDCILDLLPQFEACICDCDCDDCGDCNEIQNTLDKILILERGADISFDKELYDVVNDITLQIAKLCTNNDCSTC
jgi:hypothetical protein